MADVGVQLIDVLNNFVHVTNDIKRLTEESERKETSRKDLLKKIKGADVSWDQATILHDHYEHFLNTQTEIEGLFKKLEIAKNYLKLHLQAFGKLSLVFEYNDRDNNSKEKVFMRIGINKKGDIEFSKA